MLREYLGEYTIVYLDNIIIYSYKEEDYLKYIQEVLQRIKEVKLYFKLKKCEFYVKKTTYLGFVIEPGKLNIEPTKV